MDTNVLYYGDNLKILRDYVPDNSIDLIYLDPPFNSKATYNVLFKEPSGKSSEAQITAFEDTWHWGIESERTLLEINNSKLVSPKVKDLMNLLPSFLGRNDMMAYLTMMSIRLVELRRVLKDTGSIYLHCDPTASHYLKIILDSIFGTENFRNEFVWKRTTAHSDSNRAGRIHDIILFYSKDNSYVWNKIYQPYDDEYVKKYYRYKDDDGRSYASGDVAAAGPGPARLFNGILRDPPTGSHWRFSQENIDEFIANGRIFFTPNGFPRYKRYLDEMEGMPIQDIWSDKKVQPVVSWSKEGLDYPTQKPIALLERIISMSSNKNHVVLDPFCGCGTALVLSLIHI